MFVRRRPKRYGPVSRRGIRVPWRARKRCNVKANRPTHQVERFLIRPGVPCEVQKVSGGTWRKHRTTRSSGFERYESYKDKHYTFRRDGWFLRVHRRYVLHREDGLT